MTAHYALFGHPVEHSLSPVLHHAAFRALDLDATYAALDTALDALSERCDDLRNGVFVGANVTSPHKQSVLAFVDEQDAEVELLGAANTLVRFSHDVVLATNTDAHGLVRALDEAGVPRGIEHAVVIGAGGAARAAVLACVRRGAASISVVARRTEQAHAMVKRLDHAAEGTRLSASQFPEALTSAFDHASLVIQATNATAGEHAREFVDAMPLERLPNNATVVDLVYAPLESKLLLHAAARALVTHNGLGMLLHQAALSFERWTGKDAPLDAMRLALDVALRDRTLRDRVHG